MYNYKIVEQVKRKAKPMTWLLRKMMLIFAVIFVLAGIAISQGFMLPGFLLVILYFFYDVFSQKEYEYKLEDNILTIDVILGKRYRRTAHVLDIKDMEILAPNWHDAVARYRKNGGSEKLPKFDYTSYEEETPYYTMIVLENKRKIKLLIELSEPMLRALKQAYPSKVITQ